MAEPRPPSFARCQECKKIVDLVIGRDFDNCAEWRNENHWGVNGTYISLVDATCRGSGDPNWTELTADELAEHLKETSHG